MIEIKTNYDVSPTDPFYTEGETMTKQAFAGECEIENIMRKYEKTGILEHVAQVQGRYGDFVDAPGYQDALNKVLEAQSMFDSLPAKLRARFANDPAQFLEFAQNSENLPEMVKLGLAVERPSEVVPESA